MQGARVAGSHSQPGLLIEVDGRDLLVSPVDLLTPELEEWLVLHKAELLSLLAPTPPTPSGALAAAIGALDAAVAAKYPDLPRLERRRCALMERAYNARWPRVVLDDGAVVGPGLDGWTAFLERAGGAQLDELERSLAG